MFFPVNISFFYLFLLLDQIFFELTFTQKNAISSSLFSLLFIFFYFFKIKLIKKHIVLVPIAILVFLNLCFVLSFLCWINLKIVSTQAIFTFLYISIVLGTLQFITFYIFCRTAILTICSQIMFHAFVFFFGLSIIGSPLGLPFFIPVLPFFNAYYQKPKSVEIFNDKKVISIPQIVGKDFQNLSTNEKFNHLISSIEPFLEKTETAEGLLIFIAPEGFFGNISKKDAFALRKKTKIFSPRLLLIIGCYRASKKEVFQSCLVVFKNKFFFQDKEILLPVFETSSFNHDNTAAAQKCNLPINIFICSDFLLNTRKIANSANKPAIILVKTKDMTAILERKCLAVFQFISCFMKKTTIFAYQSGLRRFKKFDSL